MKRKFTVCVSGPGDRCPQEIYRLAETTGKAIAKAGYVLITGGRNTGVMDAAGKGARSAGGTVVGILPGDTDENASEWLDIAIKTGMGSGRNNVLVLTADVVIVIGKGAGTVSEIALAIKAGKPVILLNPDKDLASFFQDMNGDVHAAYSVEDTIRLAGRILKEDSI
jgi:uncharacterized protein (TIGR00725 family)